MSKTSGIIVLLIACLLLVGMFVLSVRRPARKKFIKRVRACAYIILVAAILISLFFIYAPRGNNPFSYFDKAIFNPVFSDADSEENDNLIEIEITGEAVFADGVRMDDMDELGQYVENRLGDDTKIEIYEEYAVSAVVYDVLDTLNEAGYAVSESDVVSRD